MPTQQQVDVQPSLLRASLRWLALTFLPKRSTMIRASMLAMLALFPLISLLLIVRPRVTIPFLALFCGAGYKLGLGGDMSKQLKWARNMSKRGPLFWIWARVHAAVVRLGRAAFGNKLNKMPMAPRALGPSVRGCTSAILKWIPGRKSSFSTEDYQVELREAQTADQAEGEWRPAGEVAAGTKPQLAVRSLNSLRAYEARARACNSVGRSEWCVSAVFMMKQPPVNGGGTGPGYSWTQTMDNAQAESVAVVVTLPSGTRAKQLEVNVKPSRLEVRLLGKPLLCGDLFAPVCGGHFVTPVVRRGVCSSQPGHSGGRSTRTSPSGSCATRARAAGASCTSPSSRPTPPSRRRSGPA